MTCALFVIAAIAQFLMWARVLYSENRLTTEFFRPERCIKCDYDLAGLPDDPTCPECGTHNVPQPVKSDTLTFRADRAVIMPAVIACTVIATLVACSTPNFGLILEIKGLGYSWLTARTYAANQARSGEITLSHICVIYYAALSPYVAMMQRRKRALVVLGLGLSNIIAMAVIAGF